MDTLDDLPLDLELRFLLKFGEQRGGLYRQSGFKSVPAIVYYVWRHDCMIVELYVFGLFSLSFHSILDRSMHFRCQTVSRLSPDDPTVNSQTSSQGVWLIRVQ